MLPPPIMISHRLRRWRLQPLGPPNSNFFSQISSLPCPSAFNYQTEASHISVVDFRRHCVLECFYKQPFAEMLSLYRSKMSIFDIRTCIYGHVRQVEDAMEGEGEGNGGERKSPLLSWKELLPNFLPPSSTIN